MRLAVGIAFKRPRHAHEWLAVDPRIRAIVLALAEECDRRGYASPIVTSILRTPDEHARIYAGRANAPASSPHIADPRGLVRAVDLRSHIYTPEQVATLVAWMNQHWPRADKRPTALCHNVGLGMHFHVQVPPAF